MNNPILPGLNGIELDTNEPEDISDIAIAETTWLTQAYNAQHAAMTGFCFRPWVIGCRLKADGVGVTNVGYLRFLVPPMVRYVEVSVLASGGAGWVLLEVLNSSMVPTGEETYSFFGSGDYDDLSEDAQWKPLASNLSLDVRAAPTWNPATVRLRLTLKVALNLGVYALMIKPTQNVV